MAKKATTRTDQSAGPKTDEKSEATTTDTAKTETTDSKPEAETKPDPVVKEDEPEKSPETEITVPEDDDVREDPRQDPDGDSVREKRARYYSTCELATRIFIAKCSSMNAKAFAPNHHAEKSWEQAEAFLDFMESKGEE